MIDIGDSAELVPGQTVIAIGTPHVAEEEGVTETHGTLIVEVSEYTPADVAGVQVGDVVTIFDGLPLSGQFGLLNALAITAPDARVEIEVLRSDEMLTLDVQLEPR